MGSDTLTAGQGVVLNLQGGELDLDCRGVSGNAATRGMVKLEPEGKLLGRRHYYKPTSPFV